MKYGLTFFILAILQFAQTLTAAETSAPEDYTIELCRVPLSEFLNTDNKKIIYGDYFVFHGYGPFEIKAVGFSPDRKNINAAKRGLFVGITQEENIARKDCVTISLDEDSFEDNWDKIKEVYKKPRLYRPSDDVSPFSGTFNSRMVAMEAIAFIWSGEKFEQEFPNRNGDFSYYLNQKKKAPAPITISQDNSYKIEVCKIPLSESLGIDNQAMKKLYHVWLRRVDSNNNRESLSFEAENKNDIAAIFNPVSSLVSNSDYNNDMVECITVLSGNDSTVNSYWNIIKEQYENAKAYKYQAIGNTGKNCGQVAKEAVEKARLVFPFPNINGQDEIGGIWSDLGKELGERGFNLNQWTGIVARLAQLTMSKNNN